MLASIDSGDAAHLSIQAELVSRRLSDLTPDALVVVTSEAHLRPERWRWPLRQILSDASTRPSDMRIAAELLEVVGGRSDVSILRHLARRKTLRIPDAGRPLAKRLAPKVYVEDLGRMSLRIGDQLVAGTSIRKKVLSLLTYLLTRPQFSASREQVIDALWPEMEPEAGANSLNQTSYFLRHILEPTATDDTAANLLDSKADLIWLDPPTFSNSKKMGRATFDVQRDHADLIRMTARRFLAPGGVLLFATNRRGFKLDHGELGGLTVKDLSRATLPFDCTRGANRHHVFRVEGP